MGMASCKDCKHYPMCGFSKYATAEKCLDFWDVSDVVKVVRCKDCKWYNPRGGVAGQKTIICSYQPKDFFCAYGERRTDGKE